MPVILIVFIACFTAAGCRAAPPVSPDAVSGPVVVTPPKAPVAPAMTERELAALASVDWVGDASVNGAAHFQKRYSMSGYWGPEVDGRRPMTTADYELRYGRATGEIGYPVVDATPEGLRLKIFAGNTFTDADVRFEMPLEGTLPDIFIEMAHDQIAVLTWDEAKTRLTVYRQANKAEVWARDIAMAGRVGRPTVAWHDNKALSVEWRTATTYERVVLDGPTGTVRHSQVLDPVLTALILDPMAFIRAAPRPVGITPNAYTLTYAERLLANPPSMNSVCPPKQHEQSVVRAKRLEDGSIAIVEALGSEGGEGPGGLTVYGPACSGVTVIDPATSQNKGRWGQGR